MEQTVFAYSYNNTSKYVYLLIAEPEGLTLLKADCSDYPLHLRTKNFLETLLSSHHLCGLVVRIPGYRSGAPGFDSRGYQIFREVVGLERGPLSLVRIIEELFE
jgi:hypothetical protein